MVCKTNQGKVAEWLRGMGWQGRDKEYKVPRDNASLMCVWGDTIIGQLYQEKDFYL